MSNFVPRLTAPNVNIKYYRHTGYYYNGVEGVNECLLIDSTTGEIMPNCVGYTWGRWYEILNQRPTLSRANGDQWFGYTADGYSRSQSPHIGDVACFTGGSNGGHVSVVEKKISNTIFITSNSYYGSTYFVVEYLKYVNGLWQRYNYNSQTLISGYTCQGFIVNPNTKNINKLPLIYYTKIL